MDFTTICIPPISQHIIFRTGTYIQKNNYQPNYIFSKRFSYAD